MGSLMQLTWTPLFSPEVPSFDGRRCLSEQAVETGRRRTPEATERGCTVLEYRSGQPHRYRYDTAFIQLLLIKREFCLSVQQFLFIIGGPGPHKQPGGVRKNTLVLIIIIIIIIIIGQKGEKSLSKFSAAISTNRQYAATPKTRGHAPAPLAIWRWPLQ